MPELNIRRVSEIMTERISREATSRREKRVGRPHQERVSDRPDPPATIYKPVKKGGVDRPGSSRVERPRSSRQTSAKVVVDFPKTPRKNSLSLSSSTLDLQSMCTTETIPEHRQSMKQKPTSTTYRLQKRNSEGPLDVSWAETSIVWGDEEATINEDVSVDNEEDYMIDSRRKSTVTEALTESMTNLNDSIMSILSIRNRRSVVHPQVDNELAEAEKEFTLAAAKAEAAAAELKRKEEKIRRLRAEAMRNSIRE